MSVLINQSYANPDTPIWTKTGAISYNSAQIGITQNTFTSYFAVRESTLQMTSADTTGMVDGQSYLCQYGFLLQLTNEGYDSPISLFFTLSYTDSDLAIWESGIEYYWDNTILTSQECVLGISLPFILKGIEPIYFSVYNASGNDCSIIISTYSESISETGVAIPGTFLNPTPA